MAQLVEAVRVMKNLVQNTDVISEADLSLLSRTDVWS